MILEMAALLTPEQHVACCAQDAYPVIRIEGFGWNGLLGGGAVVSDLFLAFHPDGRATGKYENADGFVLQYFQFENGTMGWQGLLLLLLLLSLLLMRLLFEAPEHQSN